MYTDVYIFIGLIIFRSTYSKTYYNYTLFRAIPLKESHLKFLKSLVNSYDVNFWREVGVVYSAVDFVAHPDDQPDLLKDASKRGLDLKPIIEDVQKAFDRQIVKPYIKRRMNTMDWRTYFRLDDIYAWLKDLAEAYPDEVTTKSIGKTHENRDIMSIRVALKESTLRSTVIIEGGIHAREWIAPAVVTYFISSIVNARTSKNDDLKRIALTYEWYFVPVLNPDGYEYTHTADRLWRKNRNAVPVDLNRNFDAGFEPSSIGQKWLDSYAGETAFSEKETIAMSEFVKSKSRKLEYYMAFHSYGEYMILPYGYSTEHLDNYDEVFKMCTAAAEEIYKKYHTTYLVGTPFETVGYMATGVAACWVKKTYSVPYVITFELRDKGREGFTLAPSKILPTCEETLDGVISLLTGKQVKKPRKSKSSQPQGVADQIYRMCTEAARKIYEWHGIKYLTGTVFETLGYTATGASGSWVKKTFSVPYVISFELRDEGGEGFGLSPSQIMPTCEETLDGVISLLLRRIPQKEGRKPKKDKRKPIMNSAQLYKISEQIMIVLISFLLL